MMPFIIHRPASFGPAWLGERLFGVFSVQIASDRLVARNVATRRRIEEMPAIALDRRGRVVAIGAAAEPAARAGPLAVALHAPFAPSDQIAVILGAELLRRTLARLGPVPHGMFIARGIVVRPLWSTDESLPAAERDALRAMARRAGRLDAAIWTGPPLTDEEASAAFVARPCWLGLQSMTACDRGQGANSPWMKRRAVVGPASIVILTKEGSQLMDTRVPAERDASPAGSA
jgi:hypothetical protein